MRLLIILLLATAPALADDGFKTLFDGKTLDGWRGDKTRWVVRNGAIMGRTWGAKPLIDNTFLIWDKGTLRDFDLRLQYRMKDFGDSGVMYRCREVTKWRVGGYQCDVKHEADTGLLYDELGRGYLCHPGKFVILEPSGRKVAIGPTSDSVRVVDGRKYLKAGKWNDIRIVVRGIHHLHVVNGREVIEFIDRDPKGQTLRGLLALQLHKGDPMDVEYRNIRLRPLEDTYRHAMLQFRGGNMTGWKTVGKPFTYTAEGRHLASTGTGLLRTEDVYPSLVLRFQLRRPSDPEGAPAALLLRGDDLGSKSESGISIALGGGKTGEVTILGGLAVEGAAAKRKVHPVKEKTEPMPTAYWRTVEVEMINNRLRVWVAGKVVNDITGIGRAHGPVAFRTVDKGEPIALRQMVLIPVN